MKISELINNLNNLINSNYIKNVYSNFELIEENNEAGVIKSHSLRIKANIRNFSYSLDSKCSISGRSLNPFEIFNSSTADICSKNDLTILIPDEDTNVLKVFILEMKSFNATGAAHQIRSGKNFLDYLISVHNLNFNHLPYNVEVYGILAKKPKGILKPTTSMKNRQFVFNCCEHKGYKIPTLEWNVDELLPLNQVVNNMKVKDYS